MGLSGARATDLVRQPGWLDIKVTRFFCFHDVGGRKKCALKEQSALGL